MASARCHPWIEVYKLDNDVRIQQVVAFVDLDSAVMSLRHRISASPIGSQQAYMG